MTEEIYLGSRENCSAEVEHILFHKYKIPTKKAQNFSSSGIYNAIYVPQIYDIHGRIVLPVVIKTKEQLSFSAEPRFSFRAIRFSDLLEEIFKKSIYNNTHSSIHTSTCIHVAKACQEKGVI